MQTRRLHGLAEQLTHSLSVQRACGLSLTLSGVCAWALTHPEWSMRVGSHPPGRGACHGLSPSLHGAGRGLSHSWACSVPWAFTHPGVERAVGSHFPGCGACPWALSHPGVECAHGFSPTWAWVLTHLLSSCAHTFLWEYLTAGHLH